MRKFSCMLCLLLLPMQAHALPASARGSYDKLNRCAVNKDLAGCRDDITASSVPLYDRFTSYGLANCLPQDATFVSEMPSGNAHIIRASTVENGKQRYMRLIFVNEEDRWKLDIPQSLQLSMGNDWEKQINAIEQIYLLVKQHMGAQLNCEAIKGLTQKSSSTTY